MRPSKTSIVVAVLTAGWCSQALAFDQRRAARVRAEIAAYARDKGETSDQFAKRVGSPLWHIETFVYDAEEAGGSATDALARLEWFAEAMNDPVRRQFLKCIGIRVPNDTDPPPSFLQCAVTRKELENR